MWLNGQLTQSRGLESALAWLRLICFLVVPILAATLVHVNSQLESILLKVVTRMDTTKSGHHLLLKYFKQPGADPGFFLGGDALVSCSTSTPINHLVFFLAEFQLYQKTAGHLRGGGGAPPAPSP